MKIKTLYKQTYLLALTSSLLCAMPLVALATPLLTPTPDPPILMQQQGTLQSGQQEHTFAGKKGQAIAISMSSDDFDTALSLLDPQGQEIATNDDYARTFNAAIVITLPSNGNYKILARSFAGQGGNYAITVNPATAYEQAYAKAANLYTEGKFQEAVSAYSDVIQMDASQPIAYLDRGDIYYAQGNVQGLIADYQKAIGLYQKAGDPETVQMLQEQLQYIQEPEQQSVKLSYPASTSFMMP